MGRRSKYESGEGLVDLIIILVIGAFYLAYKIILFIIEFIIEICTSTSEQNNNKINYTNSYKNDSYYSSNHSYNSSKTQKQTKAKKTEKKLPPSYQKPSNARIIKTNSSDSYLFTGLDAEDLYKKAKTLYEQKDYISAQKYIAEAVKREPSNSMYINLLKDIRWYLENP